MLQITIPDVEYYDERIGEFVSIKGQTIQLEHSLVSISKWESKWKIPFLDNKREKTPEQVIDYIRCMTITQNVDPRVYKALTKKNLEEIEAYMSDSMTATWFSGDDKNQSKKKKSEIITSELVYYWMTAAQIPFECQKWHFNRLLTLIRICGIKNAPPDKKKKMGRNELAARNHALNEARKAKYHTTG